MTSPTPQHQLADHVLGRPLAEYVAEKRSAGLSWRVISRDLYVDTEQKVDVAYETLRTWFAEPAGAR